MFKLLKTKQCVSIGLAALALFSVLLFLQSCRHPFELPNPPDGQSHRPLPPPPIEPGKRDYHWTVDTISHSGSMQTQMVRMWGDSANNIYAVGWNDQASIGTMYHYNGEKWESVKLHVSEGGLIKGGFELQGIFGFNAHSIYAIGLILHDNPHPPPNFLDSSIIIHYDGVAWREAPIIRHGPLHDVWGANENDIWVCGENGTLYHFTGSEWKRYPWRSGMYLVRVTGFSSSDVYMSSALNLSGPDTIGPYQCYLNHWNGSEWSTIDSTSTNDDPMKFGIDLLSLDHHTLYSSYHDIYQYDFNIGWKRILNLDLDLYINGSSTKNIYAVGYGYTIYHWNGSDWIEIPSSVLGGGSFYDNWTNNKETFILGMDGYRTYVMHGK